MAVAQAAPETTPPPRADQPRGTEQADRGASSRTAAPSEPAEESGAAAPSSILARATPTGPESPTPPSVEQPNAADPDHRAAVSPEAPSPSPSAATAPNGDAPPLTTVARAEPTAPELPAAQRGDLPALAPVRVVLDVARNDIGPAGRAADIRQALVAAGLEVAKLVPVDEYRSGPSVGYYFQSDRKAAAGVSHVLEPLIGAVTPVALRARGNVPEPGTIEIEVR